MPGLRATCSHVGAPIVIGTAGLACARCDAPVEADGAAAIYTSVKLPADVRNAAAFNKACRTGRVVGATKRGRVWTCTAAAWAARKPAERPRGLPSRKPKLTVVTRDDDADLRAELGLEARARRTG